MWWKQYLITKMTLGVILRRSRRACPEIAVALSEVEWVAEGIWPTEKRFFAEPVLEPSKGLRMTTLLAL